MSEHSKLEFPITTNYSPEITIEVLGIKDGKPVSVVVDTGFTGFLQIPLTIGIACNLRLWGVSWARLADGSRVKNLQCYGKIRFADREIFGVISLSETSDECLLGMQFLQQLSMDFTVSIINKKAIFVERRKEIEKEPPKLEIEKNQESPSIKV